MGFVDPTCRHRTIAPPQPPAAGVASPAGGRPRTPAPGSRAPPLEWDAHEAVRGVGELHRCVLPVVLAAPAVVAGESCDRRGTSRRAPRPARGARRSGRKNPGRDRRSRVPRCVSWWASPDLFRRVVTPPVSYIGETPSTARRIAPRQLSHIRRDTGKRTATPHRRQVQTRYAGRGNGGPRSSRRIGTPKFGRAEPAAPPRARPDDYRTRGRGGSAGARAGPLKVGLHALAWLFRVTHALTQRFARNLNSPGCQPVRGERDGMRYRAGLTAPRLSARFALLQHNERGNGAGRGAFESERLGQRCKAWEYIPTTSAYVLLPALARA